MKAKYLYPGLFILIVFLTFTYISVTFEGYKVDEKLNHLPVIEAMDKDGFFNTIVSENYEAANTPLPYLFAYLPMKLFGIEPSIFYLRIVNAAVALVTIIILILILIKSNSKNGYLIVLTVLFYPYFLKTSFTYYMAIYGVLFYFLFIYSLSFENKYRWLWAGFSLAGATMSQQFYFIIFPAAFYLLYIYDYNKNIKGLITRGLMLGLPTLVLSLPLFITWGGLTHPNYSFHKVSLDITKITAIAVITGGLFIPFLAVIYKKVISKEMLYFITAGLFFVVFFLPGFAQYGGIGSITGFTWHVLELLSRQNYLLKIVAATFLSALGMFSIYELFNMIENKLDKILFLCLSSFFAGFLINATLMERHLLPLALTIFILSMRKIREKYIVYLTTLFYMAFGSYYFYYYLYIHDTF